MVRMRTFPDIVVAAPNYWWWLVVVGLAAAAVGFFFLEHYIERVSDKRRGKPFVGIGYTLSVIALFSAAMFTPVVPDIISSERTASAVAALEEIGFEEVRTTIDSGTFGAYYEGELMRGVLVADKAHPGVYKVVESGPPQD